VSSSVTLQSDSHGYTRLAASQLGGTGAGVYHVAHGEYAAQVMKKLGTGTVNAHYPNDHTHTDAYLANVMAGKPDHLSPLLCLSSFKAVSLEPVGGRLC
jgi:hypothetical protein